MADIVRSIAAGTAAYAHAGIQRVIGRDRTAGIGRWIASMYRDQPLLLGLLLTWTTFVAIPIAAFAGYAALWAAIAFGVFWAIFLFWAGLGLLVFLVPAMCIATGLSLVAFAWAATAYYLVGASVLALFGYESLDAALGVSTKSESQLSLAAAEPTPAGTISPSNPPAYKAVDRTFADAKGVPTQSMGAAPKLGEKELLYTNYAALGIPERTN